LWKGKATLPLITDSVEMNQSRMIVCCGPRQQMKGKGEGKNYIFSSCLFFLSPRFSRAYFAAQWLRLLFLPAQDWVTQ
jgi:hypothetical protein